MSGISVVALLFLATQSIGPDQRVQPTDSSPAPISTALRDVESDLEAGRFAKAQGGAQRVVAMKPDSALAWTYLGMASLRLGQTEQAIKAYERAVALSPQDARPYFDLALLHAATGCANLAINLYEKGLALDHSNATAFYNYGRLLVREERHAEAVEALKHAVQIDPGDIDARIAFIEALLNDGQRKEAKVHAQAILANSKIPPSSLITLGRLLTRGRETELAKAALERALLIVPESLHAHMEISRMYLAERQYQAAVLHGWRAVELSPDSLEANLVLAEGLISQRRDTEARDLLLKKAPRFGSIGSFQYTFGIALYRSGEYSAALEAFQKAIRLDPKLDPAYFLLGQTSFKGGDLAQAESFFKAAVALKPKNTLYYNYLARVYEQKGDQQAAREITKQVLVVDPQDLEARERVAKWAKQEGDLPRARGLLEEIVREDPESISARVLLASVYYRLNLRKEGDAQQEAIRRLEARVPKRPQDLDVPQGSAP